MFRFWNRIESSTQLKEEISSAEIQLHKEREDIALERRIFEREQVAVENVNVVRRKCLEQLGELEHDFHSAKEEKMITLAKLDAEILAKKDHLSEGFSFKNRNRELEIQNAALVSSLEGANKIIASLTEQLTAQTDMTKVVITHLPTVSVKDVVVTQNNNGIQQ